MKTTQPPVMLSDEPYRVEVPCSCCKQTGKILTGEGNPVDCPYCEGSGKRTEKQPHPSHQMTEFRTEILAPAGTPRFYGVRNCKICELEEWSHPAGHFLHKLDYKCKGTSND